MGEGEECPRASLCFSTALFAWSSPDVLHKISSLKAEALKVSVTYVQNRQDSLFCCC